MHVDTSPKLTGRRSFPTLGQVWDLARDLRPPRPATHIPSEGDFNGWDFGGGLSPVLRTRDPQAQSAVTTPCKVGEAALSPFRPATAPDHCGPDSSLTVELTAEADGLIC